MPERKLLLITGAGASVNLSAEPDDPLPLMGDWARRLCTHIGPALAEITGLATAGDGVQFEETLGALFRWVNALDDARRFSLMARQVPDQNNSLPDQFTSIIDNIERNAASFQTQLHESLFNEFGPERIDDEQAAIAYNLLLTRLGIESLDHPGFNLVCATTNYDRSLEMALEYLGARPRTGFPTQSFRTPVLDATPLGEFASDPAVLYLHGAVGWYERQDGSIVSTPADAAYNPSLGTPAVLYPSPDKEVESTSAAALWGAFKGALAEATHVFVLGHGLNDDHLVREIAACDAKVAVSYLADGPASSERAADVATDEEATIRAKLPNAIPVGVDFGPKLSIDDEVLDRWGD